MTAYDSGTHTRYHIVWSTKYRYAVLGGAVGRRIRDIIRQACNERGVTIVEGVRSKKHVHMMVSIPPNRSVREAWVEYIETQISP